MQLHVLFFVKVPLDYVLPDPTSLFLQTLLSHMQPEHKFATATKLCHEVLQAVADGTIGLEEGKDVLGDALAVLSCKEIKVSASRASAEEDGAAEEGGSSGADGGQVGAIKRGLVSGMMKKHLVEAVVPVLVELKRQLEAEHHPLLRSLRECFCALLKDYKNEVEDILVGDKQLAKEILFDMKQLEQEKADAAAAAAAAQADLARGGATGGPSSVPGAPQGEPANAFTTPAPPRRSLLPAVAPGTIGTLPAGVSAATPLAASVLASGAARRAPRSAAAALDNGRSPLAAVTPIQNAHEDEFKEPMSVPQLRTASRLRQSQGAADDAAVASSPTFQPAAIGDAEGASAGASTPTVTLPRIDEGPQRPWNIPADAAEGTPGRALRPDGSMDEDGGSPGSDLDEDGTGNKENAVKEEPVATKAAARATRATRNSKRKA